jgi:hypothetical protein
MPYRPSQYWVRTKVSAGGGGVETFHAAQRLAEALARAYPGLTWEVEEDKVWASFRTEEDHGSQELPEQDRPAP